MTVHDLQILLTGMALGYTIANIEVALWLLKKGYTSADQIKDKK